VGMEISHGDLEIMMKRVRESVIHMIYVYDREIIIIPFLSHFHLFYILREEIVILSCRRQTNQRLRVVHPMI